MPRKIRVIASVSPALVRWEEAYVNIEFRVAPWRVGDSISRIAARLSGSVAPAQGNLDNPDPLEALIHRVARIQGEISNANVPYFAAPQSDSVIAMLPGYPTNVGVGNSRVYCRIRNDATVGEIQALLLHTVNIELKVEMPGINPRYAAPNTTFREAADLPENYLAPRILTPEQRDAALAGLMRLLTALGMHPEEDEGAAAEEARIQERRATVGHRECDRDLRDEGFPDKSNLLAALQSLETSPGKFAPLTGTDPMSQDELSNAGKIMMVLDGNMLRFYDDSIIYSASTPPETATMRGWLDVTANNIDPTSRGIITGRASFDSYDQFKTWAVGYLNQHAPNRHAAAASKTPEP